MRGHVAAWMSVLALGVGFGRAAVVGQSGDTPEKHIAAAKEAAGTEWAGMIDTLCVQSSRRSGHPPAPGAGRGRGAQPPGPPPRESYHMEPVKVFANGSWLRTNKTSVRAPPNG